MHRVTSQRMEYNLFIYQLVNQNKSSQCKELLGVGIRPYPEVATEVERIFSLSEKVEGSGFFAESPQKKAFNEYEENNPQFVHQWHINWWLNELDIEGFVAKK